MTRPFSTKDAAYSEIEMAWEQSRADGRAKIEARRREILDREETGPFDDPYTYAAVQRCTHFGVRINRCHRSAEIDWFGRSPIRYGGALVLPARPNLAVNSGLHITAQRVFAKADGTTSPLDAEPSSTNGPVRIGGVDTSTTAVGAATDKFDTITDNSFTTLWDADPTYSVANKRVTALYTITDADISTWAASDDVFRRFGLSNDTGTPGVDHGDTDFTLFSMLSGFLLDWNAKAFDITVESQSDFTGS